MRQSHPKRELDDITILIAGDSGDGVQLTGSQLTSTSAIFGNDVSTLPDFPAEIRAPAGTPAGVSAFQLHFSSHPIQTPGDAPDVLVAMNPAALKVELPRLHDGGVLIVDKDAFTAGNVRKAGYDSNPLEDASFGRRYRLHDAPITTLTLGALTEVDIDHRAKQRCRNFFTLGLLYWMYGRPLEPTLRWVAAQFERTPAVADANQRALRAGFHFGETTRAFAVRYHVPRAPLQRGTYRIVNGNEALALGFVTAARLADKPLVYSSYPITPASDVLHHLAHLKQFDVRTLQVEDEIAAMGSTIGAAFGGALALTGTSGPGLCLKSEAINLAITLEVPLVVLNVQRGGPSTGLPTKTEQADLLQALFGRNGESPIPVLAPRSPGDCFDIAIEAFRIAVRHMTPVLVLGEGYLANGAEPWRIPAFAELEPLRISHPDSASDFQAYRRDEPTLARPWAVPGTPGLEHRLGGLEKRDGPGNVSYDPENHQKMCRLRAEKVARIARYQPDQPVEGPDEGDVLVLTWGGTYGAAATAARRLRKRDVAVAHAHLRYLNPLPANLGELLTRYERVVVPELNFGQLALLVRARYLVDAIPLSKVQGSPFTSHEIEAGIEEILP